MWFGEDYKRKLVTAEEAVKVVKSGDWVEYSHFAMAPRLLDEALAKRKDELNNVKIRACTTLFVPKVVKVDPERDHFVYNSWHFSGTERKLHDQGLCNYVPFLFHEGPELYYRYQEPDVAFISVAPMDEHGFFNVGPSVDFTKAIADRAKTVIVEVNDKAPVCLGGSNESIHISQVDMIVETSREMLEIPNPKISETDQKIASLVMEEVEDGACLQLGIGAMPNAVGAMIAQSDLKDLGVHTEMLVDSYIDMYDAGRITGKNKTIDRYKMTYTFAMGSKKLYEFLDHNPVCAGYDVGYTNNPSNICLNDKVIGINNAIEVDLYGQVCSESSGTRQISGTGGQFDFIFGAYRSRGGKGLICISSTFKDSQGNLASRIVPTLTPGAIVTVPRTVTEYVITEYGKAILKGKSTWERAESLINVAAPEFRDNLIKQAEQLGLWVRSNK
ncbi:MAG: acetyl-CoA hydrolase/transferase family protein [Candidatus Saccharibacteria bacterium]